ncbi:MAG: hypothetical protein QOH06_2057 [Acidobacteriota bacterium]|nr:hypothetical protein [Acidobacteriota bacterium]
MSKLRKLNTRVVFLMLTLVALAMVLTLTNPTPVAAAGCGVETHYFSDANRTNEVGLRARMPSACECVFYGWGVITSYTKLEPAPCF